MEVEATHLEGVLRIKPKVFRDERGFFLETFHVNRYADFGIKGDFVQDNQSNSCRGSLRGLHFQTENPQGKLVRCVRGEVFDVVVDINPDSTTYRQWLGLHLSEETNEQIWIPPGYAHGFQVLSETADFEYKCTEYYNPASEVCVSWDDPDLGIDWPLKDPFLSLKDRNGLSLIELNQ